MSRKFAKLFETSIGQILVMLQRGDDGPEIKTFFDPGVDELGVCNITIGFPDSDRGERAAEAALDLIEEAAAIKAVSGQLEAIKEMFQGGEA